jgi:hypothetical protein
MTPPPAPLPLAQPNDVSCCSPAEQESCCAPEAKADCCSASTEEGCGCR